MNPESPPRSAFERAPHRTIVGLTIPVLGSLVAEPLTGLVDTAFVKELGAAPQSALGMATIALSAMAWVFSFLGIGSQTEVALARGRGDLERERHVGTTAMTFAIGVGGILAIAGCLLVHPLTRLLGADGSTHDHAVDYLLLRLPALPAVLITFVGSGILRGRQDMKTPLAIAVGVNVLNIALDPLLIFGAGPVPALGLRGAAMASSFSLCLGALASWWSVRDVAPLRLRLDLEVARSLLATGRDLFVRTASLTLFLVIATREATELGPRAGAAHQAIRSIWIFLALLLDAWAASAQSLVATFLGAGRVATALQVARLSTLWAFGTGVALLVAMLAGTSLVEQLLVPDEAREVFLGAWVACSLFQPVNALSFVTDGIHWGTRDYAFLRNAMVLITASSLLVLAALKALDLASLAAVWWVTGLWISLRALAGCLRIWPGAGRAPLRLLSGGS